MAKSMGAYAYIECSARLSQRIMDVFVLTAEASTTYTKRRKKIRRKFSLRRSQALSTKRGRNTDSCVVM